METAVFIALGLFAALAGLRIRDLERRVQKLENRED
jgi:hypothetical protein